MPNQMPLLTDHEWFMDCGDYILLAKTDQVGITKEDIDSTKKLRELCHRMLWYREYLSIVSRECLPGAATSYNNACADLAAHIGDNLISHKITADTLKDIS